MKQLQTSQCPQHYCYWAYMTNQHNWALHSKTNFSLKKKVKTILTGQVNASMFKRNTFFNLRKLLILREEIATVTEIEKMKHIASSGKVEGSDTEKENEYSLVGILRAKLIAPNSFIKDRLFPHGSTTELDTTTRVYQVWPGKNIFFFHGRLICGPNLKPLMLTTTSIILTSWVFARYVGQQIPNHSAFILAFSLILTFTVLVNLILVSGIDPGIIPRNDQDSSEKAGSGDSIRSKKVIINGMEMKLKYCRICNIFRPPRSCHCAICDNCVERFDHHSPWIGQCIAMRNHQFYLSFVVFALIFFIYIFAFSCWRLHQRMVKNSDGFSGIIKTSPETLALAAFGLIASGYLGGLAIYHVYLIAINETAYENFRQRYVGIRNPFDKGILNNLKEVLCMRVPPSRVDFRSEVRRREPAGRQWA